ncbi:hypothetical protein BC941DRAFT_418297 [Chlamydoabsidia padenii]|nr:hypothetical protein BC941DRAFT_418297 [Chlamydoabsidia padenii]
MGIPIWKPTKQIQQPTPHTPSLQQPRQHSTGHHHHIPHHHRHNHHHLPQYRLNRRRRSTLLTEPYYIAAENGDTTPISTRRTNTSQSTLPIHQHQHQRSSRTQLSNVTTRRLEVERQIEQRIFEKQELLEQLKITTSLLDQFISIRDMSGHNMALPPFITDDLLSILTATSTTLISTTPSPATTNPPLSSLTSSSTSNSNNDNDTTQPTTDPLHSYDQNYTSLTRQVDRMIGSPPYASRLEELELNIASVHHQVSDQLNQLGASFTIPSSRTLPTQFPSWPVNQSLSG